MAHGQCETCGNQYDKAFHVSLDGQTHVFDSFECAIEALAPRCTHCNCRVIGHGVEVKEQHLLLQALRGLDRRGRRVRGARPRLMDGRRSSDVLRSP